MSEFRDLPLETCEFQFVHEDTVRRALALMPAEDQLYDLAELFKVFGDSTRIKILYALFEAEMCVCDIAQLLNMTSTQRSTVASAAHPQGQQAGEIAPGGQEHFLLACRRPRDLHPRSGDGTRQRITNHTKEAREGKTMKKVFRLRDLDCANCARKMEDAIRKIDGVEDVQVSFMMQKLTLVADEARFDEIVEKAVKACHRVEPDCEIVR